MLANISIIRKVMGATATGETANEIRIVARLNETVVELNCAEFVLAV